VSRALISGRSPARQTVVRSQSAWWRAILSPRRSDGLIGLAKSSSGEDVEGVRLCLEITEQSLRLVERQP
jgi:hypothetical protein